MKLRFVLALGLALGLVGCNSATSVDAGPAAQSKIALQEAGELYRLFVATKQKAPTGIESFRGSQAIAPIGYQAIKDGSIVVRWGTVLKDTSEEGSNDSAEKVLAYEKAVPDQGGQVLMENRTVRTMTAAEFQAAPKAGN